MAFDFNQIIGKNVLITGGAGFLGSNLAKRLVSLGANVSVFLKPKTNIKNLNEIKRAIKIFEGELTNEKDLIRVIKDKDYIFHFAWQTDLKKSMANPKEDVNSDIIGILTLLEACRKENKNVKIVFSSTSTIVGIPLKIPVDEKHPELPLSVYEANKLLAEKYLYIYNKIYGMNTISLRLSNVFGEFQSIENPNRGVLNFMIGKALRGEKLTVWGKGNFIRDYCYVQNYVDAFILAAISSKTNGKMYVIGTGIGRTFNEVVSKIKKAMEDLAPEKPVIIEHVPFPEEDNTINKRDFVADYSKFKKDAGWFPRVSFDEGLKRTIQFYINLV
ncbi:GDP-mannose 4,6-dehydratase [Candidatus Pacearchaeota archaeon]|nr:GDP-mannose 4,6-dehydratase [Candidatus Pacearchaeota archaeon]